MHRLLAVPKPALRTQNYDAATKLGLDKICSVIAADSNVTLDSLSNFPPPSEPRPIESTTQPQSSSNSSIDWLGFAPIFWFGIVFFIIIRGILSRRRRGIGPGGYMGGPTIWSDGRSSDSSFSSRSDDSFSGGDGGSSGGGGAGGDW